MTMIQEIPTQELPHWMRQAQRRWDWGLLLAFILGLIAAWPFVIQPGLPRTNASENYVFMADDYATALQGGRLYPRWSPHVLNGYGAPIPHYYPPAVSYSAAIIQLLFTNDAVNAVRVVYILAFCLASVGVYLLVKRHISPEAGLISAIIYSFSPYLSQTLPHALGDLPELLALALIPIALWTADRLLTDNHPIDVFALALVSGVLLLTHIPLTLMAFALVIALTLYHVIRQRRLTHSLLVPGALLIGLSLAAFFWLPALLENDLVQWHSRGESAVPALSLYQLLQPLQPIDLNEMVVRPQYTLGWVLIGVGLLACISTIIHRQNVSFGLYFLLLAILLCVIALSFLPAEKHLIGMISLCLAIFSGNILAIIPKLPKTLHTVFPAILITILLVVSRSSWLAPRWSPIFGDVSPSQQIIYEQQGAGIAVLPPTAPLPVTIATDLQPNRFLLSGYTTGNLNKIAPIVANPRTQINLLEHTSHSDRLQAQLEVATRLDILTAYFPGWAAFSANRQLPLTRNPVSGLMYIEVPPLNGEILVTLGTTPTRQSAWVLSGLALVVVLLMTRLRFRRHNLYDLSPINLLPPAQTRLIGISILCFSGVIFSGVAPGSPFNLHARPGYRLDNAISLLNITQTGLEAVAFRLNRLAFSPGDTIELDLYWETIRTLTQNYHVQIYLRDIDRGTRWHRTSLRPPGNYPTSRWRQYAYIQDYHSLRLSDNIVSGVYEIIVEVYNCSADCRPQDRLTFFDNNGRLLGQALVLPQTIRVQR